MSHRDDTYLSVPQALSVIPGNGGIKGKTNKLESVKEIGSPESVYMALAFCFDLYRRMLYMAQPAEALREHIPPELARRILQDNAKIDGPDTWRGRAEAAQEIMLKLHNEMSEDWMRALRRAATQASTEVHA